MNIWQNIGRFFGYNRYTPEQTMHPNDAYFLEHLKGNTKILPYNPFQWYKENPFVFSAINERAKAVSNAKFYIETEEGELIENALTEKLNSPNQYQSKQDFLKQFTTYLSIWGTGYLYQNKLRPSKAVGEFDIINIETDKVDFTALKDIDFTINQLKFVKTEPKIYYKGNNESVLLNNNYLLPIFDSTTFTNPYYSESRLKALQLPVSNIMSALQSQNTFLSSPGGIGMVVKRAKEGMNPVLTTEERDTMERDLQNSYGSLSHHKQFNIVGVDVDFISTMPDVKKLELNATLVQSALSIYGAFDLPKEILTALMTGSTFENQREAYKRMMQTSIQELADNIVNTLDVAIPSSEGKLIATFDHMPVMQEDEKMKAEVSKIESDTTKQNKEIYDDWLIRGYITEQQYKEIFAI
jgi:hypothetical protein